MCVRVYSCQKVCSVTRSTSVAHCILLPWQPASLPTCAAPKLNHYHLLSMKVVIHSSCAHIRAHTHTQIYVYIYINEDTWTGTWYRLKSAVEAEMRADKRRQFVNPKFITAAWCLKQRDLLLHLLALFMKWVMARTTFFALPTRTGDDWQQNMRLIWILKVEIIPLNLAGVLFWDAE